MSQRQLASVLFAVLGIYMAVAWIPRVFLSVGLLPQVRPDPVANDYEKIVYTAELISTGIGVLLGVGLVLSRDLLARRLFPVDSQPLVARDLQAVALSVLGCYFVIQDAAELIFRMIARHEINWPAMVELVLGLGLFLGARGIARFWTFARTAGSDARERAV
jgi:drug/metabolite transporter (DMT)-like permease